MKQPDKEASHWDRSGSQMGEYARNLEVISPLDSCHSKKLNLVITFLLHTHLHRSEQSGSTTTFLGGRWTSSKLPKQKIDVQRLPLDEEAFGKSFGKNTATPTALRNQMYLSLQAPQDALHKCSLNTLLLHSRMHLPPRAGNISLLAPGESRKFMVFRVEGGLVRNSNEGLWASDVPTIFKLCFEAHASHHYSPYFCKTKNRNTTDTNMVLTPMAYAHEERSANPQTKEAKTEPK
jgi:hypothetical protein